MSSREALAIVRPVRSPLRRSKGARPALHGSGQTGSLKKRQRPRVHRLRADRVARGQDVDVHRAGQTLAEQLRRILQQPAPRRVPEHHGLEHQPCPVVRSLEDQYNTSICTVLGYQAEEFAASWAQREDPLGWHQTGDPNIKDVLRRGRTMTSRRRSPCTTARRQ